MGVKQLAHRLNRIEARRLALMKKRRAAFVVLTTAEWQTLCHPDINPDEARRVWACHSGLADGVKIYVFPNGAKDAGWLCEGV